MLMDKDALLDFVVEIIRRPVRDQGKRLDVSVAMIHVAHPGFSNGP